ncbi:MAG: TorF family putative porin [Candidatus Omnitrophota bacterium]
MITVKKILVVFLLGCILSLGVNAVNAYADEGVLKDIPIEVSADIAINSKYIWRGFTLDDDTVMQQGIYISGYGFTASIWGSLDIDAKDDLNSDEVDYSIDYTYETDNFSVSAGHTYYDFPPADTASREFYLGIAANLLLSPSLTWYHDYGDEDSGGGDGDYVVLELSHSLSLGEAPITLDLSGHVGYNNELFINGDGGDVAIGAGLTIPLTEKCAFSPNINYSIPFGDLEDSSDGNQDDKFYGGFTLAYSF